jgi:hypothetical protein
MVDLLTAEPEFCWAVARHLAELGREAHIPPHPPQLET